MSTDGTSRSPQAQTGKRQGRGQPARARARVARASPATPLKQAVVSDLPQPVAITDRELDVLEIYLGSLIDELLG